MQIPVIPHRGQKKPWNSIPRINWAHPLAGGLISYGYDAGCGYIDLVTGGQRSINNTTSPPFGGVKSSRYGTGLTSIRTASVTTGLYTLPGNTNIDTLTDAAPYSFACGLMLTATPTAGELSFLFTTCSATSSTPIAIGASAVAATDFFVTYAFSAVQATSGLLKINQFQTLLGVAVTGTTAAFYVDGVLALSPAVTTTTS